MNYEFYNVLLISEDLIKTDSTLNINLESKNLLPAIKRAQDIHLQEVIGTDLYRALQQKIYDGVIEDVNNEAYKYLLDVFICPYLLEIVIYELSIELAADIANTGVIQPTDTHFKQVSSSDRNAIKDQCKYNSDSYKLMLQRYLINNKSKYPELSTGDCERIGAHLNSAASCPINLGFARGKKINN